MAKRVVTLYIDDTSIRVLVARGNNIKKCATLPLETGLVSGGVVVDEAKVADKINELLKTQKIGGGKVITGLSGLHCIYRMTSVPYLPEATLAESVRWEAERLMPVPLEQLYLSWQIIPSPEEGVQIFLAALPRNAADTLIKTLHQAGLKPYLMDLAPLALARVVDRETAIIADVWSSEVNIVIMVEGVPQLIRSLSLPGEATSLQERLPIIREELERTIKSYNLGHPEKPYESSLPILVSGELAPAPEARQSLAEELKYSIVPLALPLKYPEGLEPSQYMVNIGLALKELSPKKWANLSVVNLNVLPEVYRPKAPSFTRIVTLSGIIAAIGLLGFLAMLVQDSAADTASLQAQLSTTNQLVKLKHIEQQSQKEAIAELEKEVSESEAVHNVFATVLDDFGRQQEIVNDDLSVTNRALLDTMSLTSVSHTSDILTISGQAPSEIEVLVYARSLRGSGQFSETIIASIKKIEDEIEGEGVSFTLILITRG